MSKNENHHIVRYRVYVYVLVALLILTGLSVAITGIELGPLAIAGALLIATIKSSLVLWYFMHLKFDQKIYSVMVGLVLMIFVLVMVVTFLDYGFR